MKKDWPADDLEIVSLCPLCCAEGRDLKIAGARDNIFNSAEGHWDYYSCKTCKSLWLDPRPTEASIGSAYANYYTHQKRQQVTHKFGFKLLRRSLANGYRNSRFGSALEPATSLGALIRFLPLIRKLLDQEYRDLPKPDEYLKASPRLLDVGAGNGGFLKFAKDIGWETVGVEPDDHAAQVARDEGLDVRTGTIASLPDDISQFDLVTLVQVVEHLHNPEETLRAIYQNLKPGGQLWLDTPNAQSSTLEEFDSDWRGLEPPRHLFIPSWQAMADLLKRVGFQDVEFKVRAGAYAAMRAKSRAIAARRDPYAEPIRKRDLIIGLVKDCYLSIDNTSAEFVTLLATVPKKR